MVQQEKVEKKYPTIGCCGLDCGLCSRYYTEGKSRCPGCAGPGFFEVNPGCGLITCCTKKNNLEVCSECALFPCEKLEKGLTRTIYDSWLTHQKIKPNLEYIKKNGLKSFIFQQKQRMVILKKMLKDFNDGRSKSYYCLSATLLSVKDLEDCLNKTEKQTKNDDFKTKAKKLKENLEKTAIKDKIKLKLNKPPHWKK